MHIPERSIITAKLPESRMKFLFYHLQVKADSALKTAQLLTMHTQEVEHVSVEGLGAHGVITGKIVDVQQHPNADRLRIVTVDTGKDMIDIVTGAPNIAQNQIVPVALPGAVVLSIDHDDPNAPIDPSKTMTVQPTTLRGIESLGMICGSDELGIGNIVATGVHIFDSNTPLGEPVEHLLHASVASIETDDKGTAHRPDLLSYTGIEQELAVLLHTPYRRTEMALPARKPSPDLTVSIDATEACTLFLVAKIEAMKTKQSPPEIQEFLRHNNVKVINLATDVTNYLMLREGALTHVFDAAALHGQIMTVRFAREKEVLSALNHQTYTLSNRDLVIADSKTALDIAGIIGSAESSVTPHSDDIMVTAAVFLPRVIRATSKRLGIRTDASARFERGQSPASAKRVFAQAVEMICRLSGGRLQAVDYVGSIEERIMRLVLNVADLNAFLGTSLDQKTIDDILRRLGYTVEGTPNALTITVPWWRTDVTSKADIYEDIARIYGYNNIVQSVPHLPHQAISRLEETIAALRTAAATYLYEVETSSMVKMGNADSVEIQNPIGDRKYMRQTFVPQLFELAKSMVRAGYASYGCFQIGKAYRREGEDLIEKIRFGMCVATDPDQAKSVLGLVLHRLHIPPQTIRFTLCSQSEDRMVKYDAVAKIYFEDTLLGHMCVEKFHGQTLCAFKLYVEKLAALANFEPIFKPYSVYPSIQRDVTFLVAQNTDLFDMVQRIMDASPEHMIEQIPHVTRYYGSEIPSSQKSITMTIVFRSNQRTLTDTEVNGIMKTITQMLKKDFEAIIK